MKHLPLIYKVGNKYVKRSYYYYNELITTLPTEMIAARKYLESDFGYGIIDIQTVEFLINGYGRLIGRFKPQGPLSQIYWVGATKTWAHA